MRVQASLDETDAVPLHVLSPLRQQRMNDLCRKLGKKFYASGSFGLNGYIFADLLEHEWLM